MEYKQKQKTADVTIARRAHGRRIQGFFVEAGDVKSNVIATTNQRHVFATVTFRLF